MPADRRRSGHPILYYLKNFRFHSVLLRYYVLIFLFFYVPFVVAVVGVTTHYSNRVREQLEVAYDAGVRGVGDSITRSLRQAEIAAFRLSRSSTMGELVQFSDLSRPSYDTLLLYESAIRELEQQQVTAADLYVVSLRSENYVGSGDARGLLSDADAPSWSEPETVTGGDWLRFSHGEQEITIARPVVIPRVGIMPGIVLARVHTGELLRQAETSTAEDHAALYLLSPEGTPIDAWLRDGPDDLLTANSTSTLLDHLEGEFLVMPHRDRDYALFVREAHRGLVYVVAVPTDRFLSAVRTTNRAIFLISGVLGLLMVPLVFAIAVHLYNPVKRLVEIAEQAELAAHADAPTERNYDEIRFITDNMTRSINRQRQLESELDRRVAMLNRSHMLALQSQISPHFLNNTLSTVNWLAMNLTGGENDVTRVVNDLSTLLRATLEAESMITTLRAELEHARKYVDIQRVRYRGMLEVDWEIPADLLDEQIVRVTVQPLIENAIYHGVKPRKKGTIVIRAQRLREAFTLSVIDDGVGISSARADRLNEDFEAAYTTSTDHIGLANVNQRLKLVFGEEYGLTVTARKPRGTEVMLTLPMSSRPYLLSRKRTANHTHS